MCGALTCLVVALPACTELDRAGIAKDVAWYTGASDDSVPTIIGEIGKDLVEKGGDPIGTGGYVAGLLATIVGGYVARRLWKKRRAAAGAPDAILKAMEEEDDGEEIDEGKGGGDPPAR